MPAGPLLAGQPFAATFMGTTASAQQRLVGAQGMENDTALTSLPIAANRQARMAELYAQHLGVWRAGGGSLYVHFSDIGQPSKWGSSGSLEFRDQDPAAAPKHLAQAELPARQRALVVTRAAARPAFTRLRC